jgi:DNA primase
MGRGIDAGLAAKVGMGFCAELFFSSSNTVVMEILAASRLLRCDGSCLFNGMLVVPLLSPYLELVGMQGRQLREGGRYVTWKLPGWKGIALPGMHMCLAEIFARRRVLLVEGVFDWLAVYGAGVGHCLPIMTNAVSSNYARWLSRYVNEVALWPDNDDAGIRGAIRSRKRLRELGIQVRVLGYGGMNCKDPYEYVSSKCIGRSRPVANV